MSFTTAIGRADPAFTQLRKLTEISRALTYTTSLEQVTRLTVERGAELLDASAAVLMLSDSEGLLQVRAAHGVAPELVERFSAPLDDEVIGRLQGLLAAPDDRFLAVPLVVAGAVTGLVAISTPCPCTAGDESLLAALADQAAVALENARIGGEVLHDMRDRLAASEGATTAKDRALATLAHDIRTPLGAIDGYCQNMEGELYGPVTDRQRETLGRVRQSGAHLLSLLDNVMDMARLAAGILPVEPGLLQLGEVARDAVHMVVPAAESAGLALGLAVADEVVVVGDPARARQILVNLIGNAVKFTQRGGSVSVRVSRHAGAGNGWGEIRVVDTGPGIPEADLAAVFEPYFRSEATVGMPGVGLGLAISHALAKQMGGELRLESEVGVGSTFILRLPAPRRASDG